MAWNFASNVLTQTGEDTSIAGIPAGAIASNTVSNTGVRTIRLNTGVRTVIQGRFYHNMERERLIITIGRTSGNDNGLEIRGGTYWTAYPRDVTRTVGTTETFADPNAGATLPATGTDDELFLRTTDATVHRWSGTAWVQQTPQQLSTIPWTTGTGVEFTGEWTWFGGSFNDTAARRYAFALTQGGTWGAHGGRWLGKTTYIGSGSSTFNQPSIQCYGSFAYVIQELSGTTDGTRSDDPNRAPITRFYNADLSGVIGNFDYQGGNFSISTPANRTPPTFTFNRSAGGYGYGFQHFNEFDPSSTTRTYPTVRNVSVSNNIVDSAAFQRLVGTPIGQRLQNILETTDQINVNGLEVDGGDQQQRNNNGYTFITRQLETGIARAPNAVSTAQTTQGIIYATDVNNNLRRLTSNIAEFNDSEDYVYSFTFNDTITDYEVTSGTTSGAGRCMANANENEICVAINSVNKTGDPGTSGRNAAGNLRPRSNPDTGIWRLDRRLNDGDTIDLDIWSYENAYERRNVSLTGYTGTLTLGGVLAADPYISRSRTDIIARRTALETAGFSYTNTAYTTASVDTTLTDIYDVVKYNKENRSSQRNVPSVTELPLTTDGRTLDLGSRAFSGVSDVGEWVQANSVLAEAPFNRLRTTGTATISGGLSGFTLEAATITIPLNATNRTYRNGGFDSNNPVNLQSGATLTNWNFDCNLVGNWNTGLTPTNVTLGRNAVTFALNETGAMVASGPLLDGVVVGMNQTLTLTSPTAITVNFPAGMSITNNSIQFGGGTVTGGNNVTLASATIQGPSYVQQPQQLVIQGLPMDNDDNAHWQLFDWTGRSFDSFTGNAPTANWSSVANTTTNGVFRLRGVVDPRLTAAGMTYQGVEAMGLGDTITQFRLVIHGREIESRVYDFSIADITSRVNVQAGAEDTNGNSIAIGALEDAAVDVPSNQLAQTVTTSFRRIPTQITAEPDGAPARTGTIADSSGIVTFNVTGHSLVAADEHNATGAETNALMASMRNLTSYGVSIARRVHVAAGGPDAEIPSTISATPVQIRQNSVTDTSTAPVTPTDWDIINTPTLTTVNVRRGHYGIEGRGGAPGNVDTIEIITGLYETENNPAQTLIAVAMGEPYLSRAQKAADAIQRASVKIPPANNPSVISNVRPDAPTARENASATIAEVDASLGVTRINDEVQSTAVAQVRGTIWAAS